MRKFGLLLLMLFSSSYGALACDCPPWQWSIKGVNRAIEYFDVIFIGERIPESSDANSNGKYSFKIIDAIKGNIKAGDIIYGSTHNSCSGSPNEEGLWIIYATLEEDGLIDFADIGCGASRSLYSLNVPPPPPLADNKEQYQGLLAMIHLEYIRDWQNEYILLQSFKNQNTLVEVEDNSWFNDTILSYVAIVLALLAVVITIFKK